MDDEEHSRMGQNSPMGLDGLWGKDTSHQFARIQALGSGVFSACLTLGPGWFAASSDSDLDKDSLFLGFLHTPAVSWEGHRAHPTHAAAGRGAHCATSSRHCSNWHLQLCIRWDRRHGKHQVLNVVATTTTARSRSKEKPRREGHNPQQGSVKHQQGWASNPQRQGWLNMINRGHHVTTTVPRMGHPATTLSRPSPTLYISSKLCRSTCKPRLPLWL
jgi:hypothetical protein